MFPPGGKHTRLYAITHSATTYCGRYNAQRRHYAPVSPLFPGPFSAGFVAVLVGYASRPPSSGSRLLLRQAPAHSRSPGWMTALGFGMGISTLALSWWYKAPESNCLVNPARRRYWLPVCTG
ncbi:benzoate/H(+) symporter BenE family transporter [Enterobacter cloacae subsp. cloacae]|nr:benzoate/H(+) symporter BenE family transporter [Enterobacter cloacae subsp. cloacae]